MLCAVRWFQAVVLFHIFSIEKLHLQHPFGGLVWRKIWTRVSNISYLTHNLTPQVCLQAVRVLETGVSLNRLRLFCSRKGCRGLALTVCVAGGPVGNRPVGVVGASDGDVRDILGSVSASTSSLAQIGEEFCSPFLGVRHLLSSEEFWILWHLVGVTRVSDNSYLTQLIFSSLPSGSPSTRNRRVVEQIASVPWSKGLPRPCMRERDGELRSASIWAKLSTGRRYQQWSLIHDTNKKVLHCNFTWSHLINGT